MKIKRNVSDAARAANRQNAQKSTGPKNVNAIRENAFKHGLLARHLRFENEEDAHQFDILREDLEKEYEPCGRTEDALIEEMAVSWWKMGLAHAWEMEEFAKRRNAAAALVGSLTGHCDADQIPLFAEHTGSQSAAQLGWECEQLLIRNGAYHSEADEGFLSEKNRKIGRLQVEAKLCSSIETVFRYQAALRRDFYRALGMLRDIKKDRLS